MAKKKWYVVTVGKAIGIFDSWLEVAPLVRGVSDAVHQSFTSEEEAKRLFEQETARGNTQVVGNDVYDHLPYTSLSPKKSPSSSPSWSLHTRNPPLHHGSPGSRNSQRHLTHKTEQNTSPTGCTISRSTSEFSPSSSSVLVYKLETQQPSSHNRSTKQTIATHEEPRVTRAVVQTPSWLTTSYPSGNKVGDLPLSPISKRDIALSPITSPRHLIQGLTQGNFGHSPRISSRIKTEPESSSRSSSFDRRKSYNYETQGVQPQHGPVILHLHTCHNCNDSSVLGVPLPLGLVQPMHVPHIVHEPSDDPRSPMTKRSTVPISTNSLSFGRPSPNLKREESIDTRSSLLLGSH